MRVARQNAISGRLLLAHSKALRLRRMETHAVATRWLTVPPCRLALHALGLCQKGPLLFKPAAQILADVIDEIVTRSFLAFLKGSFEASGWNSSFEEEFLIRGERTRSRYESGLQSRRSKPSRNSWHNVCTKSVLFPRINAPGLLTRVSWLPSRQYIPWPCRYRARR